MNNPRIVWDYYGNNVADAIRKAAANLETTISDVDYEVIDEGKQGFLGFGHINAHIKAGLKNIEKFDYSLAEYQKDSWLIEKHNKLKEYINKFIELSDQYHLEICIPNKYIESREEEREIYHEIWALHGREYGGIGIEINLSTTYDVQNIRIFIQSLGSREFENKYFTLVYMILEGMEYNEAEKTAVKFWNDVRKDDGIEYFTYHTEKFIYSGRTNEKGDISSVSIYKQEPLTEEDKEIRAITDRYLSGDSEAFLSYIRWEGEYSFKRGIIKRIVYSDSGYTKSNYFIFSVSEISEINYLAEISQLMFGGYIEVGDVVDIWCDVRTFHDDEEPYFYVHKLRKTGKKVTPKPGWKYAEQTISDNTYDESETDVDTMTGREFELFTERLLEANGFTDIEVTQASNDLGVDVLAEKDFVKYAIQCKRYSGSVGIEAVQQIIAAKSINNCHVAVVLTTSTFSKSAVTLAEANGVFLWDRERLEVMMKNM